MKKTLISRSLKDTGEIARDFMKSIKKGSPAVVSLSGELGAGKTAFTKALGAALGVKRKMSSPTFVLIKKYPLKNKTHKFLYHLDAYRLKNKEELFYLGWKEIVKGKENLVLIEWPERVRGAMPKAHRKIKIKHHKNGHRIFEIKS